MLTKVIVSVFSLLLSVASLGQCDEKYLIVHTSEEIDSNPRIYKPIKEALEAFGEKPVSSDIFTWITDKATYLEFRENEQIKTAVYRMLRKLNDGEVCDQEIRDVWLKTYALVKASKSPLWDRFSPYLLEKGSHSFGNCARTTERTFNKRFSEEPSYRSAVTRYNDQVKNFMKFVMDKLDDNADDEKFYQVAKKFSLEKRFKSRRLRKFAAGRNLSVADYLSKECENLLDNVGNIFEQLNLGRALASFELGDPYLLKINEFYRIVCVEPQRPNLKEKLASLRDDRKLSAPGCLW